MASHLSSETVDEAKDVAVVRPDYTQLTPSAKVLAIASQLGLERHQEGGYFKQTDKSPFVMENPYYPGHNDGEASSALRPGHSDEKTLTLADGRTLTPNRSYSTLIYYLLTCESPLGRFHVNRSRIIHILQGGRGQYVLIYPDGRVKSFRVGFDYAAGEVSQWVVPGGVWKASFVTPAQGESPSSDDHLLISEVVVPGFEFEDHQFLAGESAMEALIGSEQTSKLEWLLGENHS